MKVLLEATDRIVCEYHGHAENPKEIVVAYHADAETYVVVGRNPGVKYVEGQWELYWRADWDSAIRWWSEMISDIHKDTSL